MKYTEEQLSKIHEYEIEILEEIIRICEKHGIQYFSAGGTTLGAVRHNNIIPWDDDIDIGMLRPDYERFIRIAPEELKNGMFLQHYSTEPLTPTYYAKVRKDGTVFAEEHMKELPIHKGVFVDVFPYDKVPENEQERKKLFRQISVLNQLFVAKVLWKASTFHGEDKKALLTGVRSALHIACLPLSRDYLFNKLDRLVRKYNDTSSSLVTYRAYDFAIARIDDYLPAHCRVC